MSLVQPVATAIAATQIATNFLGESGCWCAALREAERNAARRSEYPTPTMSKLNRQRGASYEREVANAIFDQLGIRIRRNLKQYQVSDEGDLILGKYLIECKRRRKIAVYDFMEQAEKACEIGQIPLVIMREDGNKSLAMLRLSDLLTLLGNELTPHQPQDEPSPEGS